MSTYIGRESGYRAAETPIGEWPTFARAGTGGAVGILLQTSPTPIGSASASPSAPISPSPTPEFPPGQFGKGELFWVDVVLLLLMAAALLLPLLLSWGKPRFYETPYINWFLLHYGIGALAIFALLALALSGSLTSPLIAIFAGLFGFIFGVSASRAATQPAAQPAAAKQLAVHAVKPSKARGGAIAVLGQGFDQEATVRLDGVPLTNVSVSADGSMLVGTLGGHADGTVDVVVENRDGTEATLPSGFTYGPP